VRLLSHPGSDLGDASEAALQVELDEIHINFQQIGCKAI
jgi:hypothetical protein